MVSVQFQSLTSLKSLPACGVEVFDVSANRLTSLSGIEQLPKLTALTADGNAITDLTGLGRCLNVRKLSLNGANVSDLSELRALTKLQDITLSHCTRRELLIPLHKSSLTRVTLVDCDLRGDFFHSFDRERAITSLTLIRCELDSTSGLEDFTGLTELTVRGVSGSLDWSALGSLPLQTVTADALQAEARAALAACNVARSSPILVEIMARGVDKGAAVRRVCNHLGLAPARGSRAARRTTPPMASSARSRRSSGKENRRAGVSPARPRGAAVKRRCGTPTGPGRPGRPAPPCRARTT